MTLQEIAAKINTKTTQEQVEAMLNESGFRRPEVGFFLCDAEDSKLDRTELVTGLLLAHAAVTSELH